MHSAFLRSFRALSAWLSIGAVFQLLTLCLRPSLLLVSSVLNEIIPACHTVVLSSTCIVLAFE